MLAAMSEQPRATLVVGSEPFLAERAVSDLMRAALKHDAHTERHEVDLAAEGAAGELQAAVSPTLFGGGIVLVATGVESAEPSALDVLVDAVQSQDDAVTIVIVHPGGTKGRAALDRLRGAGVHEVAVDRLKGRALDDFVAGEFRRHARKVESGAVAALRAAVGDDLRALSAAASQLSSDIESDPITEADVGAYYEGVAGASAFAVSDAVWSADPIQALVTLRWALSSDPSFGPAVVAIVAGALRSLLRLAGAPPGMSDAELAKEVGVPAWKLSSVRAQLRRWTPRELADATRLLASADVALKGGEEGAGLDPAQKRTVLERSLLTIATRSRPQE